MPGFRRDPTAATQVISFLVAGLAFIAVIGYVMIQSAQPRHGSVDRAVSDASQDKDAELLSALLNGAGSGWAGGNDAVSRLGLSSTNGTGLSAAHIAALQGASLTASLANGKVDYPDARIALGLASGQDFHLAIKRVGNTGVSGGVPLTSVRTAYIGAWSSLASVTVSPGTPQQVQDAAQVQLNLTMLSGIATERQMIKNLGVQFNDRVFISTLSPTVLVSQTPPLPAIPILTYLNLPYLSGDVYPAVKSYIDNNLPGRLSNYDLLVIGSGVDQSVLTASGTKNAIANWVLAGGRLMILGSDSSNYQWLQPMFAANIASVSGAMTAPDPNAGALTAPWSLSWPTYNTHGLAWDIKTSGAGAHYNDFDHIVQQGGYDVLAISHKGGFGSGYVVLSSFRPRELASSEANHLMANLIQYKGAIANYTLDYGPAVPTGVPVAGTVRSTTVLDPVGGAIQLEVDLFVWGG